MTPGLAIAICAGWVAGVVAVTLGWTNLVLREPLPAGWVVGIVPLLMFLGYPAWAATIARRSTSVYVVRPVAAVLLSFMDFFIDRPAVSLIRWKLVEFLAVPLVFATGTYAAIVVARALQGRGGRAVGPVLGGFVLLLASVATIQVQGFVPW